jgi:hypothetical protein
MFTTQITFFGIVYKPHSIQKCTRIAINVPKSPVEFFKLGTFYEIDHAILLLKSLRIEKTQFSKKNICSCPHLLPFSFNKPLPNIPAPKTIRGTFALSC